jgi:23S rRNA pseudouridine2605 synthase
VAKQKQEQETETKGERIAKVIARAGVCSRREAERLIEQGRVAIDGKTLKTPATLVEPGSIVTVDGEPLAAPERARLFRYHKPTGVLTTEHDPLGRQTIYDTFPPGVPRLMPVGRLDYTSEGLLLLTNDGGLKRHLELPSTGWLRRYRVRAFGRPEAFALANLRKGTTIDDVSYGPIEANIDSAKGGNVWLTVSLREGKNREVRRVMEHIGLQVNRLIRVAYGPFLLGDIPRGGAEEVPRKMLREQIGAALDGKR